MEIYFTDDISQDYVLKTADYFEKNDLILNHKHSIQLTSSSLGSEDPGFRLKMILNKDEKALPAEDSLNLSLLEEDIKEKVFDGANFRIIVCNENFEEIK